MQKSLSNLGSDDAKRAWQAPDIRDVKGTVNDLKACEVKRNI